MATCKATNGEYECGLISLKNGLCEKHYIEKTNGKPIFENKCIEG